MEDLESKNILAISNQPFVQYQQRVLGIETVGPMAEQDTSIRVYIDALAACE